jgi:hypothetical protein
MLTAACGRGHPHHALSDAISFLLVRIIRLADGELGL